jgi:hypothetical protein
MKARTSLHEGIDDQLLFDPAHCESSSLDRGTLIPPSSSEDMTCLLHEIEMHELQLLDLRRLKFAPMLVHGTLLTQCCFILGKLQNLPLHL